MKLHNHFRPPVTDELKFGHIQQENQCIDIEIGHVPAIAKLVPCNVDRDTQVIWNNICTDLEIGHVPAIVKLVPCNVDRYT